MTRWYLKEDGRMRLSVFNKLTESFPLWGSTSQSLKHKATISPSCTVIVNMTLGLKGLVISGSKGARHSRASILPGEAWKRRESFHSRGQHLWQLSWTKESVCLRKRIELPQDWFGKTPWQLIIVLEHQNDRHQFCSLPYSASLPSHLQESIRSQYSEQKLKLIQFH